MCDSVSEECAARSRCHRCRTSLPQLPVPYIFAADIGSVEHMKAPSFAAWAFWSAIDADGSGTEEVGDQPSAFHGIERT